MEAAPPRVRVARDDSAPGPLRLARLTRGWRQEDLAARAGCSRRYVSLIEAGYVPAPHVQEQLAAALGLDVADLFGEPGRPATGNGATTGHEVLPNGGAGASSAPAGGERR